MLTILDTFVSRYMFVHMYVQVCIFTSTNMNAFQVFQLVPAVTTLESEDDARFAYFRDVILSPLLVSF